MIVDVSHHQGTIDWAKARPSIDFAIIRVQDGTMADRQLARNVSECQRLGIPYYLYGFYRGGGRAEALRMVSRAKAAGATRCLGYVVDLEVTGVGGTDAAIAALREQGGRTGLYIAHNLVGAYGLAHGQDWTWIPRYGANTGRPSTKPSYACDLWQYSSNGTVPGIPGRVDVNACMGKPLEWFTGGAATPSQPSTPAKPATLVHVRYGLHVLGGGWLDEVTDFGAGSNGFAGYPNRQHDLLYASVDRGTLKYRAHVLGGGWLDWVTKGDRNDTAHGCAGIPGRAIDGVQAYYVTPEGEAYQQAWYRSQTMKRAGWLPVCCDDGTTYRQYDAFAGILGEPLDRLQLAVAAGNPFR